MRSIFLLAALSIAAPLFAGDAAAPKVVAFNASVRVEVDASGKPVKVEAPADLPEAIRGFVEKRVRSWQYQPAKIEGVAQPAVTYVSVNACAVPVAEGYRLGVDFNGNGPRTADDRRMNPPVYPALAMRAGTEAEFKVILSIDATGTASVEKIEHADIDGRGGASTFEPALRSWAKTVKLDLEQVSGKPVPTRVRVPVSFKLGGYTRSERAALVDELQAKAIASRECQVAAGDAGLKPVALQQPAVTVTPTPAG